MKEAIIFVVGAGTGAAGAIVFSSPIKKEMKLLADMARTDFSLIISKFHTVISRLEAVAHKLEAKL